MSQQNRVGSHKTAIMHKDGYTAVYYHHTPVVMFNEKNIILFNDGYYTSTTKTRMNQTAQQFDLDFSVYQKNFDWFVDFKGETMEFFNGMELHRY